MKCNVQAKALIQLLLIDRAPDTHAHTQIPQKKMDLPASCGLAETSEPDRRRDATSPASTRCDQPSVDERQLASTRCDQRSSRPEQRREIDPRARPRARADGEPDYSLEQTGHKLIVLCSFVVFSGAVRSCVACAYWSTVGNLARISRIGRETSGSRQLRPHTC